MDEPAGPQAPAENPYTQMLTVLAIGLVLVALVAVMYLIARDGQDEVAAGVPSGPVAVELTEFAIGGLVDVAPGAVVLEATNDGSMVHDLVLEGGPTTPDIPVGGSARLDLGTLDAGSYTLYCSIAGHRESGMEAVLTVAEGASTTVAAGETDAAHADHEEMTEEDYARLDQQMLDSFADFPAETAGLGGQDLAPVVLPDGTLRFELTASIIDWEVEPGKVVEAWAYNEQVPAPTLRIPLGSAVEVHLVNNLPMGTDIHLHGIDDLTNENDGVAPITQDLVGPGEEFTYRFTADTPAVAMYHPHHHGHTQVINGMLGTVLVGDPQIPRGRTVSGTEIPADLDIAREINMVLNDAGTLGLTLNGKSFPATEAYAFEQGDWFVVNYLNEGLMSHPMHMHGFPGLVFGRDGIPLDSPWWADTVSVAPGERVSMLFQAEDVGTWVWHCHILNHAERDDGMFGMVTAVIIE